MEFNGLAKQPSFVKFWLARLFGKKIIGVDFGGDGICGVEVIGYAWRDHLYITDEKIIGLPFKADGPSVKFRGLADA